MDFCVEKLFLLGNPGQYILKNICNMTYFNFAKLHAVSVLQNLIIFINYETMPKYTGFFFYPYLIVQYSKYWQI